MRNGVDMFEKVKEMGLRTELSYLTLKHVLRYIL